MDGERGARCLKKKHGKDRARVAKKKASDRNRRGGSERN